jgi:hypothetical protein
MMSEWRSTFDDWPDWEDGNKPIEARLEDGRIVQGVLRVDDFFPDGEGGEIPIFIVEVYEEKISFADVTRWKEL